MTVKRFWDDPYLCRCDTTVVAVQGREVALAESIIFAFSGGQERDHGTIGGAVGGEFGEKCFQFIMGFGKLAVGQAFLGAGQAQLARFGDGGSRQRAERSVIRGNGGFVVAGGGGAGGVRHVRGGGISFEKFLTGAKMIGGHGQRHGKPECDQDDFHRVGRVDGRG